MAAISIQSYTLEVYRPLHRGQLSSVYMQNNPGLRVCSFKEARLAITHTSHGRSGLFKKRQESRRGRNSVLEAGSN